MPGESQQMPSSQADPSVLTTEQLLREVDRVKELMEARLEGMEEVFNERFNSVDTQFGLIEDRRVEQKADTEKAVSAALDAAKEAVKEQTTASDKEITKSETSMTEQLKQLKTTFDNSFGDLKERVIAIESTRLGAAAYQTALIAVLLLAVAIYAALH